MVDRVKLKDLFFIEYGNQFDKNKMTESGTGINFVSRATSNLGVDTKIEIVPDVEPYEEGLITATLGGTYLLSCFVQPQRFYTGQNIKVLRPIKPMTFNEKAFYCLAISKNRFRYTSHGREANKTFDDILVPPFAALPNWVNGAVVKVPNKGAVAQQPALPKMEHWQDFRYDELFEIERGRGPRKSTLTGNGNTPFITSTDSDNGLTGYTAEKPRHKGNVVTVNRNGSVGEAFYQPAAFSSTEDVHVFNPKFPMTKYIGVFLATLIRREKFRFNYGRKWGLERMNDSTIKLPANANGEPDWNMIENYVKSLPYSASL